MDLLDLARKRDPRCRTRRESTWDRRGANDDWWEIAPGETRVLAELEGPAVITHLWLTSMPGGLRDVLLRITWDDAAHPSVVCPVGDFFGLGHDIVNSYESRLFSASTNASNQPGGVVALNCYVPMPFKRRARFELVNEGPLAIKQYFYIDYETLPDPATMDGLDYFHAEFRRAYPFCGRSPGCNVGQAAWDNNYVILETTGAGRYIGCNLSVTNFNKGWWGEGDDMIWVDGFKWPPDLHGTGSEDYFNQAWGMQPNAFQRNGSTIWEEHTGGYQTCYVHHLENPVHFTREIKVTIEHNHANQASNEMSSVAYWYAAAPTRVAEVPPVQRRQRVPKRDGIWVHDEAAMWPGIGVPGLRNPVIDRRLREFFLLGRARFYPQWSVSRILPGQTLADAKLVALSDRSLDWRAVDAGGDGTARWVHAAVVRRDNASGLVYLANRFRVEQAGEWEMYAGHDGGLKLFLDGELVATEPAHENPAAPFRTRVVRNLARGEHEIVAAIDFTPELLEQAGMFFSFFPAGHSPHDNQGIVFPERIA